MASPDDHGRRRDSQLSLNAVKIKRQRSPEPHAPRMSIPNFSSLTQSTIGSPTSSPPVPPPQASAMSSVNGSKYVSSHDSCAEPPQKRLRRDEQEPSQSMPSLPSISEALKNADVAPPPQPSSISQIPDSPSGLLSFTDAPRGPGNPFSQPLTPASAMRSSIQGQDASSIKPMPPPPAMPPDKRPPPASLPSDSPRLAGRETIPGNQMPAQPHSQLEASPFRSSFSADPNRPGQPFHEYYNSSQTAPVSRTSDNFQYEHNGKFKNAKLQFKPHHVSHTELIKRHLEIFDAELALSEMHTSSVQLLDFAKEANQRYHTTNKQNYINDALPHRGHIEEMLKIAERTVHNLEKLRDVAIMQETALNEQRARAFRGPEIEDDYQRVTDGFRGTDYSFDAKKRRGKAAPPGRCHSCNRAETPEWRRGPDGARTLCNACGLHYAKLTRKVGPNKAANITGSNLRPKSIDDTRP